MKKLFLFFLLSGLFTSLLYSQAVDTMYVYKSGAVAYKSTLPSIDSIIFYKASTAPAGTVTDIDGNVYTTVVIGTRTWMVENLKVTRYRNGDAISNVTDNTAWAGLTTGAYCWYNNNIANKTPYGALYNWFAVNDPRNIAPAGWHVPSDAEWTTLITYLGGESVAGGKMKEAGTTHWLSPNTDADNSSGFAALPGGYRFGYDGTFDYLGIVGGYWSSTQNGAFGAWYRSLYYDNASAYRSDDGKQLGLSVRCVRD